MQLSAVTIRLSQIATTGKRNVGQYSKYSWKLVFTTAGSISIIRHWNHSFVSFHTVNHSRIQDVPNVLLSCPSYPKLDVSNADSASDRSIDHVFISKPWVVTSCSSPSTCRSDHMLRSHYLSTSPAPRIYNKRVVPVSSVTYIRSASADSEVATSTFIGFVRVFFPE